MHVPAACQVYDAIVVCNGEKLVGLCFTLEQQAHVSTLLQCLQFRTWRSCEMNLVHPNLGHYSEPNLPTVPGEATFPGLVMHSHNYRTPEPFAGQTVLVVGASNSGEK